MADKIKGFTFLVIDFSSVGFGSFGSFAWAGLGWALGLWIGFTSTLHVFKYSGSSSGPLNILFMVDHGNTREKHKLFKYI